MTKRLLHSYGAIQCLEKLLGMLAEGGFILVNDYGQTQITRDDEFEHQRFSLATFVGVNFSLLRTFFGEGKRCQYIEPGDEEGRGIHARLLAPAVAEEVFVRFHERFGEAAHKRLQEPIQKARACAKAGRFELRAGSTARQSICSNATGCCYVKSASSSPSPSATRSAGRTWPRWRWR